MEAELRRLQARVRELEATLGQQRPVFDRPFHEVSTVGPALNSTDPAFVVTHNSDDLDRVFFVPIYLSGPIRVKSLSAWIKTTGSSCVFSMGLFVVPSQEVRPDATEDKPLLLQRLAHASKTRSSTASHRWRVVFDREIVLDPVRGFYFFAYACSSVAGKWWVGGHSQGYRAHEKTVDGNVPSVLTRAAEGDAPVPAVLLRSQVGDQVFGVPANSAWVPTTSSKVSTSSALLGATSPILVDGGAGPVDLSAARTLSHANSGASVGTYGDATNVPQVTVDAKGHVTSVSNVAISAGAPTNASYVTLGTNGTLTDERVLTAGTGFALTDAGAGATVTVGLAAGYGLLSGLTNDQVAVASGASSLDGSSSLTFDGTNLYSGTRVQVANTGTGAPLVVGNQSSANSAPFAGSAAHFVGADSADAVVCLDAIGSGTEPVFLGRGARGTLASKTQASNGHVLVRLGGTGYTSSSAYVNAIRGSIDIRSTESWTSSANGTAMSIRVTNKGTTTLTTVVDVLPYAVNLTPAARKSTDGASAPLFLLTANSDTALTASTNVPDSSWVGATKQHATGAGPARQADHQWTGSTHSAVAASTYPIITSGYTKKPTAGTNMTITLPVAHEFEGHVLMTDGRILPDKGADVSSAGDMTLGTDGSVFVVTGTTTINGIKTAEWQAGSIAWLIFASTPTVKHNTAPSAGYAKLKLAGSVDLVAAADTVLGLVYDGTYWQEFARKVA